MTEQNAINKQAEDFLIRKSAGDPFVHFELTGTQDYSIGIDDSDSDKLKITDGSDPSSGTEYWMLTPSTSTLETPIRNIIQTRTDIGNVVSNTISNADNTNSGSAAALFLTSGGGNSGDPFIRYRVTGAGQYSVGIDNTDADKFKITDGGNPSLGTELFTIYPSGSITRNLLASFTSGFDNAGQINSLTCRNPNTTNTQSRAKFEAITPSTGGDCWYAVVVSPTKDYVMGIDNSDGDRFKINENAGNAGPSGGTEVFSINPLTRDIKFNGAYEFPTADGTIGQVLATDGAGNVDWQTNSASGKTIQQVRVLTTTQGATAATIPFDNTIPQQTEGTEIFTLSITPTSASNILMFDFSGYLTGATTGTIALFQDATANALYAIAFGGNKSFRYYMTAGTTSSTTFKIRYGAAVAGTVYLNRDLNGNRYGGVAQTNMTITEITP